MSLKEDLNKLKAKSETRIPEEKLTVMHGATEDLEKSGLIENVLEVGDRAPEFRLQNAQGDVVDSRELLARGPLVVNFYRGGW